MRIASAEHDEVLNVSTEHDDVLTLTAEPDPRPSTAADGCDSGASQKPPLERTYQHTCVAVSDDGVTWTKPKLRLIKDPLTGTLDNNLVRTLTV